MYISQTVFNDITIVANFTEDRKTIPNVPVLIEGLKPVNWNGAEFIEVEEEAWDYNYITVAPLVSNNTLEGKKVIAIGRLNAQKNFSSLIPIPKAD